MKSFKIILFIVIVSFVLAFLVPASIKKAYIPYFAIPYVNQYTFQIIDLLPKNVESSKFTRKLVDTFIIWVDREVSDLEIEQKKYEIDNLSIAKWLDFPKGINLWKAGILLQGVVWEGKTLTINRQDSFSPWVRKVYGNSGNNGKIEIEFWWPYYYDHSKIWPRTNSTIKLESLKQFVELTQFNRSRAYGWFLKTCKEFENQAYKGWRSNMEWACIYDEKKIDDNTYKFTMLIPHIFAHEWLTKTPIRLAVVILHKTLDGYFIYTYEKSFPSDYIEGKWDPFPQLKDIFEKRIPETIENLGSDFDNAVNLVD